VRVVVITQQLDLSGAVGRLVAGVLFGLEAIPLGDCLVSYEDNSPHEEPH
jgi:hypothetical protein